MHIPTSPTRQQRRLAARTPLREPVQVGPGNRAIRRQVAAEARGKVRPDQLSFRQALAARLSEEQPA